MIKMDFWAFEKLCQGYLNPGIFDLISHSSGPAAMCLNNRSFDVTQEQPMLTVMFLTVLTLTSSSRLSTKTTSNLVLSCWQVKNLVPLHLAPGLSQKISVRDSERKRKIKHGTLLSFYPPRKMSIIPIHSLCLFMHLAWQPHFHLCHRILLCHSKDPVVRASLPSLQPHPHPVSDVNDPVQNNTIIRISHIFFLRRKLHNWCPDPWSYLVFC